MPLPTSRKAFTAEEAVSFVEEWQGGYASEADRKDALKTYRPLLQKAFSVLTYLCTDNRDVEEAPEWTRKPGRKKTGKGRKARDRDPFWVRVGWYIGPALHEARVRAANNKRRPASSTVHSTGPGTSRPFGSGRASPVSARSRPPSGSSPTGRSWRSCPRTRSRPRRSSL
jgi:hypothetical protein